MEHAFHWLEDATSTVTATTSSQAVAILRRPSGRFQIRIYNGHTVAIYIRKGTSIVVATATDMPIAPGSVEVLTINNADQSTITHIGVLAASTSGPISITTGDGI